MSLASENFETFFHEMLYCEEFNSIHMQNWNLTNKIGISVFSVCNFIECIITVAIPKRSCSALLVSKTPFKPNRQACPLSM